MKFVVFDIYFD